MNWRVVLTTWAVLLVTIACAGNSGTVEVDVVDTVDDQSDQRQTVDIVIFPDQGRHEKDQFPVDASGPFDLEPELPLPLCDPGEGCFLDPCTDNQQCLSGWCVEHLGEGVCTQQCQEECPPGWSCKQVAGTDPDIVFVCVSGQANLCKPCTASAECKDVAGDQQVCVDYGPDGDFCGGPCHLDSEGSPEGTSSCPWGFSCLAVTSVEGIESTQCVADTGVCPCTAKSIAQGLWTHCEVANQWGSCTGVRTCLEDALSPCDAPAAAEEACNGIDDDCDGEVDEPPLVDGEYGNLCHDGNPCTEDSCQGETGCANAPLEDIECVDGDPCTVADHCVQGICAGQPLDCADDNPCTDDLCNGNGGCTHPPNSAACDDGDPCTVADQCSDGACGGFVLDCQCQADDDCLDLEDGNLCNGTLICDTSLFPFQCRVDTDTVVVCPLPEGPDAPCLAAQCAPETGECQLVAANSGGACDDGSVCTVKDTCLAGTCQSGAPLNCNDGNVCTDDLCDPETGCQFQANQAACTDNKECTVSDVCVDGVCLPGPQQDCDDGNPCTADGCVEGVGCQNVATDDACDDGDPCTVGDQCSGGACQSGAAKDCHDGNPCTLDFCGGLGACQHLPQALACDDGNLCTADDKCWGVVCAGLPVNCNDGNPCTLDQCAPELGCVHSLLDDGAPCGGLDGWACDKGLCHCAPDCFDKDCGDDGCGGVCGDCDDDLDCTTDLCQEGQCSNVPHPFYCNIGGFCIPSGAENPENPCLKCLPGTDPTGWSTQEDGVECGSGKVCYQGACCNPVVNCQDKACGDDGCGGGCGDCGCGEACEAGACIFHACDGKECGDDGCQGTCGTCPNGQTCDESMCQFAQTTWAKPFGGTGYEAEAHAALAPNDNLYLYGGYRSSDFEIDGETLPISSLQVPVLIRLDSDGEVVWHRAYNSTAYHDLRGNVASDALGRATFVGSYTGGATDFGGGPLPQPQNHDIYVVRVDAAGNHVYSYAAGGSDQDVPESVTALPDGGALVTGYFDSPTINFGGDVLIKAGGNYNSDLFVLKLDADGEHVWSKRFGGSGDDHGRMVGAGPDGAITLLGHYGGQNMDLGGGPLPNATNGTPFLAHFDGQLNHLWSTAFTGTFGGFHGGTVGPNGHIVVHVTCYGEFVQLGGDPMPLAADYDMAVAMFDASGNHVWSHAIAGDGEDFPGAAVIDDAGNTYFAGSTQSLSFDLGAGTMTGKGNRHIFVIKYAPDGTVIWSTWWGGFAASDPWNIVRSMVRSPSGALFGAGNFETPGFDFGVEPISPFGQTDFFVFKLQEGP